ncbi:MAG: hypothetical protein FJ291_16550 [Planctomycetes bacterium]|nr:hypothetical protein [Planctomycetota bacterium]
MSPELFERTVSLHLDHAGIKAALVAIAAAMGRDAVLDNDDVPQDIRNRHISLHVDDAPCAVPLALLCFALGANWEPEVEDVRVELSPSSPDEGDTEKELYLAWGAATTREETVQLAALVEKLLNDLAARAGTVPRSSCKARPGHYLDVSAPPNALRLVDHLRSWLANLEPGEHRELPSPAADARALRHKALELRDTLPEHLAAALKKQVQPPAKAMHAAEALADLGAQARATLVLDPDAELPKAEVKLEGDKPTLADALRALEGQTGTVHVATGHALLFTTPERARLLRPAAWAIYDVRNLASDAAAAGLAAGLLKECQKHNEWARHHFIEHHKRRLIVCTTTAIHERIVASLKGAARQRAEKREGRGMGAGE